MAYTVVPPMFRASWGVPPLVVTVVASLMVAVIDTTSPAFSVLFCMPVAELIATLLTVGTAVSMLMLGLLPALPLLPAVSV